MIVMEGFERAGKKGKGMVKLCASAGICEKCVCVWFELATNCRKVLVRGLSVVAVDSSCPSSRIDEYSCERSRFQALEPIKTSYSSTTPKKPMEEVEKMDREIIIMERNDGSFV